mmetsp:Transcript_27797/g.80029  ORF Transcript_27797/g.80029 Transcript_27797/m.80029 type:complete len:88 (+) Transcript_27797:140-403(+)
MPSARRQRTYNTLSEHPQREKETERQTGEMAARPVHLSGRHAMPSIRPSIHPSICRPAHPLMLTFFSATFIRAGDAIGCGWPHHVMS